jgi:hypothetical protein
MSNQKHSKEKTKRFGASKAKLLFLSHPTLSYSQKAQGLIFIGANKL